MQADLTAQLPWKLQLENVMKIMGTDSEDVAAYLQPYSTEDSLNLTGYMGLNTSKPR